MRVCVVAEFYPRAADPVLGHWAHRQALAARAAGADVRVLVLHRPVPPVAALRAGDVGALRRAVAQPLRTHLDGLEVSYVPFPAPPRAWSYGSWGAWAAPSLALALRGLRRRFPYDLVHAHYGVPAGDAVRRARAGAPLLVSVHGGDVLYTARRSAAGARNVRQAFAAARLVLPNSAGIERRTRELGARATRVVHLGADVPPDPAPHDGPPTLITVAHLVARKRHGDVLRALARLPDARYVVVGDGPERAALEALARELGVADRVELRGQLEPAAALAALRAASVFVLPSTEEAFGVAYVEAMAAGLPAVGRAGEDGPEEIAALGEGMLLAPPADPDALVQLLAGLLANPEERRRLGRAARETVSAHLTWERCGVDTVAAYQEALR
jgi:teichuronic acid biosynthesis glycosyltransferase TuaC